MRRPVVVLALLWALPWHGVWGPALAAPALAAPALADPERAAPGPGPAQPSDTALFTDETEASGLDFRHQNGMAGAWAMAEIMGAGVALFDYDGDGDLDLFLVQGGPLDTGARGAGTRGPTDRLWRNDSTARGPRFVDVTAGSGFDQPSSGARGYGMGVATGDFDLDGRVDLYLAQYGPNQLWRNRGDGTFENVTARAGADDPRWSVSASFLDYDLDGDLDLYVANYVASPLDQQIVCKGFAGHRDYCGPQTYPPERDRLLRNRGDGTFEDVSDPVLGSEARGAGLGVVTADFDDDGRPDLYVANDLTANHLWLQRAGPGGEIRLVDEALLAGAAINGDGLAEASMGVVAGDLDGDGDLDLFMTHHDQQTNTFYRNEGGGFFVDASLPSGLGNPSWNYTGFGTALADFDLDGHLDLVVVNGAVTVKTDQLGAGSPFPFAEPNQLFLGRGGGRFVDASERGGSAFAVAETSRGLAWGDLDDDGDVDLVWTNNHGRARLLLGRAADPAAASPGTSPAGNTGPATWVGLRLLTAEPVRTGSARDAQGARARLHLRRDGRPGSTPWQRFGSDGSYASAGDPRRVFAVGSAKIEAVEVRWENGEQERFPPPPPGRYTTLRRGQGKRASADEPKP